MNAKNYQYKKLEYGSKIILVITAMACQPADCITSTCAQTEVNNHPASLRVTCGQHIESPHYC